MKTNNTLGLSGYVLPVMQRATNIGLWNGVTVGVTADNGEQQILVDGKIRRGGESLSGDNMYDIASLVKLLLHLVCHTIFEGGNPKYAFQGFTPETKVSNILAGSSHGEHFNLLTISHLMRFLVRFKASNHLSTFADQGFDAVINRLIHEGLEEPPGTVWGYFNHTSLLLGHCVERLTGKPLHQVMEECLFEPLGMNRTTFFPRKVHRDGFISKNYVPTADCLPGEISDPSSRIFLREGKTCGVAGVFSPVSDLLKVGQMLLRFGLAPDRSILIPSARVMGLGRNTLPTGCHTAGGEHVEFGDGAGLLHMFCKGQAYGGHPIVVTSPGTIHKLGHPGHIFFFCPVSRVSVVICSDNIAKPEMATAVKRKEYLYPTMTAILAAVLEGIKGYQIRNMNKA